MEAEALLQEAQVNSTIVRFSGIYGGNRTRLIEQVCEGRRGLSQDLQLSNRIHEDDCVGFLMHLMQLAAGGETLESCYLASDSCPVDMNEVVQYIADQHGIQLPADRREIPRRAGNKRCDNRRMLATGYQLKYPDYREGYRRQPSAS